MACNGIYMIYRKGSIALSEICVFYINDIVFLGLLFSLILKSI